MITIKETVCSDIVEWGALMANVLFVAPSEEASKGLSLDLGMHAGF